MVGVDFKVVNPNVLQCWMVQVAPQHRPINNFLTIVNFVISLCGLPVENANIPAIWFTKHE
jgi:hypothetical protein